MKMFDFHTMLNLSVWKIWFAYNIEIECMQIWFSYNIEITYGRWLGTKILIENSINGKVYMRTSYFEEISATVYYIFVWRDIVVNGFCGDDKTHKLK